MGFSMYWNIRPSSPEVGVAVSDHYDAWDIRALFEDLGDEAEAVKSGHLAVRDQGGDLFLSEDIEGFVAVGDEQVADAVGIVLETIL